MLLFSILLFAATVPSILAAPLEPELLPRSGSISYNGCSAGEQTLIQFALQDAQKLAVAGASASEATNSGSAAYQAWWGTSQSLLTNERLNSRFEKMSAFLVNPRKDITFDCANTKGCTLTSTAATDKDGQRILICNSFWSFTNARVSQLAPPQSHNSCTDIGNYRTRGSQLLHELTHVLFFTNDEEQPNQGKGSGYGHSNCLDLAAWNSNAARNNADSYAMWAIGAYYGGIDNWATKPSQICGTRF